MEPESGRWNEPPVEKRTGNNSLAIKEAHSLSGSMVSLLNASHSFLPLLNYAESRHGSRQSSAFPDLRDVIEDSF
jgi:hypothetical protein